MSLVPNWRAVLMYAWSVRLLALAGILTGLEAILPLVPDLLDVSQGTLAAATFLIVMSALIARFVAQSTVSGSGT